MTNRLDGKITIVTTTPAVTAAYAWSSAGLTVNVGGGIGTQLVDIPEKSPASRSILFDEEHMLAGALQHESVSTWARPPDGDGHMQRQQGQFLQHSLTYCMADDLA